jgi:hypothetical protein
VTVAPVVCEAAVVLSCALVTVKVLVATVVTSMISESIRILNCPVAGKVVALVTTKEVTASLILPFRVVIELFANFSVAMRPQDQKDSILRSHKRINSFPTNPLSTTHGRLQDGEC